MNYKEYAFTASEITQLEYILSIMPESREIERIGLEYRLEKAKQRLEGVPIPPRPILTDVKFQGKPVVDDVGMEASFTGRTTEGIRRINGSHRRRRHRRAEGDPAPSPTEGLANSSSPG